LSTRATKLWSHVPYIYIEKVWKQVMPKYIF